MGESVTSLNDVFRVSNCQFTDCKDDINSKDDLDGRVVFIEVELGNFNIFSVTGNFTYLVENSVT